MVGGRFVVGTTAKFESRGDVRRQAGVESQSDGTPANHKTNLNPEQSEWVAEALLRIESEPSAALSFRRGSVIFCLIAGAAPATRAYPCLPSDVP